MIEDLNQDIYPDLILFDSDLNHIDVLLGNGDGSFTEHGVYSTVSHPFITIIADFNSDDHLDIAVPI